MPSGLISISAGSASARRMSATSLGKGSAERPWNERVQSIFSSGAVSSSRGLSASPLLEMLSVVGRLGVPADTRDAGEEVVEEVGDAWFVAGVGFAALSCRRVALLLIARVGMAEGNWWCEIRMRGAWEIDLACWRVSNARQGRQRRADMVRCGGWRSSSCDVAIASTIT